MTDAPPSEILVGNNILKNNPGVYGLRFSMSPYKEQEQMTNIPLYLAGEYLKNLAG